MIGKQGMGSLMAEWQRSTAVWAARKPVLWVRDAASLSSEITAISEHFDAVLASGVYTPYRLTRGERFARSQGVDPTCHHFSELDASRVLMATPPIAGTVLQNFEPSIATAAWREMRPPAQV